MIDFSKFQKDDNSVIGVNFRSRLELNDGVSAPIANTINNPKNTLSVSVSVTNRMHQSRICNTSALHLLVLRRLLRVRTRPSALESGNRYLGL